jgi:hypothetical protein
MTGCCPVQGESLVDRRRPTADTLLCSTLEFELCLGRPTFDRCRVDLCLLLNRRRHRVDAITTSSLGFATRPEILSIPGFPRGFLTTYSGEDLPLCDELSLVFFWSISLSRVWALSIWRERLQT